jgi:hypothetical protein
MDDHLRSDAREMLAAITEARATARAIVRNEALGQRRAPFLAQLQDAIATADPRIQWWLRQAVWVESREYLATGKTPTGPALEGDPVELACRVLVREGRPSCPQCRRPLPNEAELDRWRSRHDRQVVELLAFEAAV